MRSNGLLPVAALLGAFLFPVSLLGQEAASLLRDAREKYEQGMADLMGRIANQLRVLDAPAAVRSQALKSLERGQIADLAALTGFAAEAEEYRRRLLTSFEGSADRMLRNQDAACDQVLVEQGMWQVILDSLPWRPVDVTLLEKSGDAGLVWRLPEAALRGYRLQIHGSVGQGTVEAVELVLPVALREKGIVRIPVIDSRFAATLTVGPTGEVSLDLGVTRDEKAFARRQASVSDLQITAGKAALQVRELQWKPFLVRTDEATVASEKPTQEAAGPKQPESGSGDAVHEKKVLGAPKDAASAAASTWALWHVGVRLAGWRTSYAKPQTQAKDCSLRGRVKSVANDQIVFELDERWRGPRDWVTPQREWVWKRTGVDKKTGAILLELVEARKDGTVVTRNPRGSARLEGNTMRGSYRVDFTNGVRHSDSDNAHEWILEIQPATRGR